ncbi:hypothetical protein L6472_10120 [Prevotella sp. E13-17]|uniref:hypothetical protein n=1 Tax=Prevotella sp. E13-17 TaxID=2913616 RepID=UPI001EDA6EB2|nr:hypothetical protein [Prevotella sp. E13-17]UKK50375.1 hypothetical protein L6472_10120 [Prevotella sp. E13-17]
MVKERNLSIELLKFIAVIIVANSHMELLYGDYSFLVSGGAIGDSLFFLLLALLCFWAEAEISQIGISAGFPGYIQVYLLGQFLLQ